MSEQKNSNPDEPELQLRTKRSISRPVVLVVGLVVLVLAGAVLWMISTQKLSLSDLRMERDSRLTALEARQSELSAGLSSANRELAEGQGIGLDPTSLSELAESIEAAGGLEMLYPEPLWQYSTDEREAFRMQTADIESQMKRIETGQASLAEAREDLARHKIETTG